MKAFIRIGGQAFNLVQNALAEPLKRNLPKLPEYLPIGFPHVFHDHLPGSLSIRLPQSLYRLQHDIERQTGKRAECAMLFQFCA